MIFIAIFAVFSYIMAAMPPYNHNSVFFVLSAVVCTLAVLVDPDFPPDNYPTETTEK